MKSARHLPDNTDKCGQEIEHAGERVREKGKKKTTDERWNKKAGSDLIEQSRIKREIFGRGVEAR